MDPAEQAGERPVEQAAQAREVAPEPIRVGDEFHGVPQDGGG